MNSYARLLKAQRRHPAGSPRGGQFAPGKGSGAGGGPHTPEDFPGGPAMKLAQEFRASRPTNREMTHAETELEAALLDNGDKMVARNKDGQIAAVLAYSFDDDDGIHIEHLGSLEKGAGGMLMRSIIERADEAGLPITLVSSTAAQGFYSKLGFTKSPQSDLWSREAP